MKKVLFAMLALSALFFSCKEKDSGSTTTAETAVEKTKKTAPTRFIYSGWALYEERDDGKMYAVREAETGDNAVIYLNDDNSIETKNAIRRLSNGKEEPFDFIHINYNEECDYWTRDIFVAGPNVFMSYVVVKDTFAYSAPDGASITGTQIPEGSTVVSTEFPSDYDNGPEAESFYKVTIYNGKPFGREIYLKRNTFSCHAIVQEIARTFAKIDKETPVEVRDEVLLKLIDMIQAESGKLGNDDYPVYNEYLTEKFNKLAEKGLVSDEVFESLKNNFRSYSVSE